MGSVLTHGIAKFQIDGEAPRAPIPNLALSYNAQHVFEAFVSNARWMNYTRFGTNVFFRRHSALRPYTPNIRHRGRKMNQGYATYSNEWEQAQDYEGSIGGGNGVNLGASYGYPQMIRYFNRSFNLSAVSAPIGSYIIDWRPAENGLPQVANGGPATGLFDEGASHVDIPYTTIGNIHKHPYNRGAWFNETSIVALSQGRITLGGVYNPPENKLLHHGQQIYYAKSGGTGVIVGAVKTTGETFPAATSAARFRDTTFAGFSAGDVGKYIAIHGVGIYLITAFVDASNVDTDAVTINESFTNVASRTWTLRTGPIAEYFWRRRGYAIYDYHTSYAYEPYSAYRWQAVDEILHGFGTQRTEWNQIPQRTVYDGYSHWWWTTPNRPQGPGAQGFGLMRQLHMSPQPFQAPVFDGSLTGFTNWGVQATTGYYEDIIVDQNRKLWISCCAAANGQNTIARVHPAPGGNAAAPVVELLVKKQATAADATGLTTRNILTMCDDRSGVYSGGAGTHRIWALGGNNGVGDQAGGLNYSDDDGATWKRVHKLVAATGTVLATNGTNAILGTGTLFTTEFAVGDWIRFGADTRSYLITVITDNLNMTIAPVYAGTTGAGKTLQKGALASNEAIGKTGYSFSNDGSSNSDGQHNIDWDTLGRVYWLSQNSPTRICRWDESAGAVVSFAETSIPATSPLSAILSGHIVNLKVSRIPDLAGVGAHPFHNDIWLGCTYNGQSDTNGGWVRVIGSTFTDTPVLANFTRYHYNLTTDFPNGKVQVPSDGSGTFTGNPRVLQEPITGNIVLFSGYSKDTSARLGWHWLYMTGPATGATAYWQATQNHVYDNGRGIPVAAGTREPYCRGTFDETGMGAFCAVSGQTSGTGGTDNMVEQTNPPMTMNFTCWMDRRWNGSAWITALAAGSIWDDLNLRGGTNVNTQNLVLGAGTRRVHEWSQPLVDGMYISFIQAGGAVAQTDEFLADETSTFVAYVGAGKDNTQTCTVGYQFYVAPTAYHVNVETTKLLRNMWTVDGGVEGGYTTSTSGAAFPPFTRGSVDYFKYPIGYGNAAGYLNTNAQSVNSTTANHPMAALRIADEGEFTADGSVTASSTTFTSAGAHTFVPGDVGKSIIVEGIDNNTVNADNGQAVIMTYVSPTQVTTDKVFVATGVNAGACRWKLRDIPAVAFVSFGYYNTGVTYPRIYWTHDLYSSKDYGQNWTTVATCPEGTNSSPLNGPDPAFAGTWHTVEDGYPAQLNLADGNMGDSPTVIFDLRSLPENTRRRQYWSWRTYDANNDAGAATYYAGMFLYDDNFVMINRPAANKLDDADDPLYQGNSEITSFLMRASGTGATPVDDGNADGLTNTINVTGPLYLATGTNDASVTGAGHFIAPSSMFTRTSVGKYVRIAGAANAANNGFALITGFVSDVEVQTSKNFTAEVNTFNWAMLDIGPGDKFRIDSAVIMSDRGTPLNDSYHVITDVPSTTQILVQVADVPHPITAAAWDVQRDFANQTLSHDSSISNFDTLGYIVIGHIEGTMHFSYDLEWVDVQLSTVAATTPADDDADGKTDKITMGESLLAAGGATDGPMAGDFIEYTQAGYGTRMLEIVSITGSNPSKVVKVKYDELPVSASSVTWKIKRRRDLSYRIARVVVVGKGASPP